MTVLDAYAVIAYLRGEKAADAVATLLESPTWLSAVNAAEVMDQLVRVDGHDRDEVEIRLATLQVSGMTVCPISDDLGIAAGALRARHYHQRNCNVSLADCFAAATALGLNKPIATADPHLLDLVTAEGGTTHVLAAR
jgi:PIN domain nuclease of toxin-antitoxin system